MNDSPANNASQKPADARDADAADDRLSLEGAQRIVDEWIQTIGVRYFDELTNLAQLVEEVGELARLLSRTKGEQSFRPGTEPTDIHAAISDEMADVLFVLLCLANQSGIDLATALRKNLEKKTGRDLDRHVGNAKLTSRDARDPS